jgi:chromosomal replication initiator protein
MQTLSRWVATPENRSALLAVQCLADCLGAGRNCNGLSPLFLHGPSGTGKSHLAAALVSEVTRRMPHAVARVFSCDDPEATGAVEQDAAADPRPDVWQSDLLVIEDLQRLRCEKSEALVQLFDERQARQGAMVFTASVGPGQLVHLPARLTSRLACGLVVGLEPLSPTSRLAFLQDRAERRQLALSCEVLAWLAENLGGSGRQLEGAIARLETLVRVSDRLPDLPAVTALFRDEVEAARPTVERIAERVGRYFHVQPRDLQSRRRGRSALLPRQVGMYLARQLTPLSLEQNAAYFGGRDHTTVLHACRKVERALTVDATLSGTVRLLHADLA